MTKYRCTKCGAEDSDRTTSPPTALICTNPKCREGADPRAMQNQQGMFPVTDGYYPWGEAAPQATS